MKSSRVSYGALALLIPYIFTQPIFAQSDETTQQTSKSNDEFIITASGKQQLLSQTPVVISQLNGDEIDAIGAIRIGEVLSTLPGVFFSGLNGPREIAQIRQPLAFDNRTLFLEDGVPLQSSIFFDQSALGYSIALASPGTIEVVRGPGTALHGSDALSGVIHIRSKEIPDNLQTSVRLRGGQFGLFDLAGEVGGALSEDQKLSLTIAYSGEEGFRDETAFERLQFLFKHEYSPHEDLEIKTILTHTRFNTESATAIDFDDFLAGSRASGLSPLVNPDDVLEIGRYARAQSTIAWSPSQHLRLELTPYYRRQDIAASATFQPATLPRTEPRLFWEHHKNANTVIGLDVEFSWFDRFTFQDAPDTVVFGNLFLQGTQFDYEVSFRGLSPYIQHSQTIGALTIDLGLRYDNLEYDFTNNLIEVPGDARLQVEDRVDNFEAVSPKAGLVWQLNDNHHLFFRYARGFRIPRESDLYELEDGQTDFTLTPERLNSFDLGWRANFLGLDTELVGYWSVSQDGLITDVQTAAGNITINAGSSRFAGVELSANANLGAGFSFNTSFAFQDFRFRQRSASGSDPFDGNLINQSPRTLGTLSLNYIPPLIPQWSNTARLRHIGRQPLNDANTVFTDNEFILDLFTSWQIGERLIMELKLENVTDNLFPVFANAPFFAPGGRARPGNPRTLSGGVRIVF